MVWAWVIAAPATVRDTQNKSTKTRADAEVDRPRFSDREQLPLPDKPPYTAHLGNLAYDVSRVDIEGFLSDCQVTNVRIVEDKIDHKPKGFGYVEFASLDGLKAALAKTESPFMGRNIKISVAEPRTLPQVSKLSCCDADFRTAKDRAESSRDFSDWSRKGPLPDLPQNQRQTSNRGFSRNFDNASDAGSERGGSRRPGFFEGDGKVRDFSNWERKGPLSPAPNAGPPMRDGGRVREGGPPQERRQSPAWGEGRSDAGSRPPRRDFEPRPPVERAPTAAEQDSQWRTKMRPDPSPAETPEASTPTSPATQAPKERPRLNLAKRTVSTADPEAAGASTGDAKASPFGAARPVDSAARERAVEEKRELAIRQKAEEEEKAKAAKAERDAAKATQDAADRAARGERADRGQNQEEDKVRSPTSGPQRRGPGGPDRRPSRQQNGTKPTTPKENGDAPAPKPGFSILSHENEDGDAGAEEDAEGEADAVDAPANGTITNDKDTKPSEIVREAPTDGNADTTAETMEEEGWSTVAKPKSNRRGGQRAMAS